MSISALTERIEQHYADGRPFVIYAHPGQSALHGLIQQRDSVNPDDPFANEGFLFYPFEPEGKGHQISKERSEVFSFDLPDVDEANSSEQVNIQEDSTERDRYMTLLEEAKIRMSQKGIQKIVTSRNVTVPIRTTDLGVILQRLFLQYPSAFRYMWFHPDTGLWCGATPELLVETDGTSFATMALAGTRPAASHVSGSWTEKEREEQQLVVDFIVNRLQRVTAVVKLSPTYTHQAGSVVHLRTDITGILKRKKTNLERLVQTLHPTSAVCGMPRKKALDFLMEREGYHRAFYSGFLGYHQAGLGQASIFVNLRCMRLHHDRAEIFVGGGITDASDPLSEWNETVNKQQTMLQVLAPLLSNS